MSKTKDLVKFIRALPFFHDTPITKEYRIEIIAKLKHLEKIKTLFNKQAQDEALQLVPDSMPEAYIQQELEKLHEVIKNG